MTTKTEQAEARQATNREVAERWTRDRDHDHVGFLRLLTEAAQEGLDDLGLEPDANDPSVLLALSDLGRVALAWAKAERDETWEEEGA